MRDPVADELPPDGTAVDPGVVVLEGAPTGLDDPRLSMKAAAVDGEVVANGAVAELQEAIEDEQTTALTVARGGVAVADREAIDPRAKLGTPEGCLTVTTW